MYKISKEKLSSLFETISERTPLYMPIMKNGQSDFYLWQIGDEYCDSELNTVRSAKDLFFPQSENLYTCKKDGKNISIEPQALKDQNFVVFGMRACDVQGVKVLDKVFLGDPVDTFYQARREHGTIVALNRRKAASVKYLALMLQSRKQMLQPGSSRESFSGSLSQKREML